MTTLTKATALQELKELHTNYPGLSIQKNYPKYMRMTSLHTFILSELKKEGKTNNEISDYFSEIRGW